MQVYIAGRRCTANPPCAVASVYRIPIHEEQSSLGSSFVETLLQLFWVTTWQKTMKREKRLWKDWERAVTASLRGLEFPSIHLPHSWSFANSWDWSFLTLMRDFATPCSAPGRTIHNQFGTRSRRSGLPETKPLSKGNYFECESTYRWVATTKDEQDSTGHYSTPSVEGLEHRGKTFDFHCFSTPFQLWQAKLLNGQRLPTWPAQDLHHLTGSRFRRQKSSILRLTWHLNFDLCLHAFYLLPTEAETILASQTLRCVWAYGVSIQRETCSHHLIRSLLPCKDIDIGNPRR